MSPAVSHGRSCRVKGPPVELEVCPHDVLEGDSEGVLE